MEPARPRRMTPRRAFTVTELIVVIAIMAVISLVVVSGQNNFNQSLLLTDTAYAVALSVREAQSLGVASRGASGAYNFGYGVHFSTGSPNGYTVFADTSTAAATPSYCPVLTTPSGSPQTKTGNCLYDGSSENVQAYSFNRGFTVGKFCGKDLNGTYNCSDNGYFTTLDIVYLRPNTTAVITGVHSGTDVQLACAEVYLLAPTGGGTVTRSVRINQLGEVSVNETCP